MTIALAPNVRVDDVASASAANYFVAIFVAANYFVALSLPHKPSYPVRQDHPTWGSGRDSKDSVCRHYTVFPHTMTSLPPYSTYRTDSKVGEKLLVAVCLLISHLCFEIPAILRKMAIGEVFLWFCRTESWSW